MPAPTFVPNLGAISALDLGALGQVALDTASTFSIPNNTFTPVAFDLFRITPAPSFRGRFAGWDVSQPTRLGLHADFPYALRALVSGVVMLTASAAGTNRIAALRT